MSITDLILFPGTPGAQAQNLPKHNFIIDPIQGMEAEGSSRKVTRLLRLGVKEDSEEQHGQYLC